MTLLRRLLLVPLAAVLLASTAACDRSTAERAACAPKDLRTLVPGTLTLSTGLLTRSPWVVGGGSAKRSNDPRLGKGYDAALGYALASRLGFDRTHVTWVGSSFPDSVKPGAKPFDVSLDQATVTPERRKDVDMVAPYWRVRPVVVTLKDRPLASVASLAALRDIPLAAQRGKAPRVSGLQLVEYDDLDAVRDAVSSGRQQGMLADYNTALRISDDERQLVGGEMVAVLPAAQDAEEYGLVLQKGSALTRCVDDALAALRREGTVERLEERWLVAEAGLRELR